MKVRFRSFLVVSLLAGAWLAPADAQKGKKFTLKEALAGLEGKGELRAKLETSHGVIEIKLYETRVPFTVANFVGLARGVRPFKDAESGQWRKGKFYDGTTFHRVIPNFMIQGGDPTATGRGGPGFKFADELYPTLKHDRAGIVSMANSGPNTNGSQFFITDRPTPHLDGRHSVFGQVVSGLKVVRKIARVKADKLDKPLEPVVMKKVTVYRVTPKPPEK